MHHSNDLYKLVIQAIKNDLSSKDAVHICLALTCIANIGTPEMAEEIGDEVPKILTSPLVFAVNANSLQKLSTIHKSPITG